jgi:acetylxylan esterase
MALFTTSLPRGLTGSRFSKRALGLAMGGVTIVGAAGFAGLASVPASATAVSSDNPCAAVHITAARATGEAPGAGIIGALVTLVQNGSHQTVSTSSVNYPAALLTYANSTAQGDSALKSMLQSQETTCPNQKQVLVGYSQGAQLVGDVLGGGGGGVLGATSAPVTAAVAGKVVAVIQMGDPRHLPNQSFNVGTGSGATGLFPRGANQSLAPFAAKIQSYCDTGDPFCAGGANIAVHLNYTDKYDNAAESFILGKIGG